MAKNKKFNLIDTGSGEVVATETHSDERAEKENHCYLIGASISGGSPLQLMPAKGKSEKG